MHPSIEPFRLPIQAICRRRHVRRLDVFGSATGPRFDPATSDLDVVVEFDPLPPAEYVEHFFGLQDDLSRLLGRTVDVVVERAVRNPFFRDSLNASREPLFAA